MNKRDLELLSSYLDGQLKPSDSARLEARLKTEPELVSVLEDLRAARNLLRRLPTRKAPRNFTLTRKMVGLNPPLPRAYPMFRFTTVFATLLFFFTFGLNTLFIQLASQAPAYGMGGGGAGETELFAAEAPQADVVLTEESVPAEEPSVAMVPPASTTIAPTEGAARSMGTPHEKTGEAGGAAVQQLPQPQPLIPSILQIALAVIAVLSALFMLIMRQLAVNRWR
jgi:anti-sigma factor RsiW